jgi:hypothetical protein
MVSIVEPSPPLARIWQPVLNLPLVLSLVLSLSFTTGHFYGRANLLAFLAGKDVVCAVGFGNEATVTSYGISKIGSTESLISIFCKAYEVEVPRVYLYLNLNAR